MTTTTTTTDSSASQRRSSARRTVFAVVAAATLLVIAGCTSTNETAPDTTVAEEPSDSASTTTSTPPLDPLALLTAALDNYGEGYQFESVAEVGDEEAVSVTGVVIDSSAQMEVVSGDGTATYITTPKASWVRVEGGEWQNLDTPGPVEPPLAALASPTSVKIIGSSGNGVTIVGIYDGSVFTSEETVELEIVIKDGLLLSASYATANAKVSTSFGPLDGATIDTPGPSA